MAFGHGRMKAFSVRGRGKVKRRGPAGGRSSLHTRDGGEIAYHDGDWAIVGPPGAAQGSYPGITFQREPSYGYSHLLL